MESTFLGFLPGVTARPPYCFCYTEGRKPEGHTSRGARHTGTVVSKASVTAFPLLVGAVKEPGRRTARTLLSS